MYYEVKSHMPYNYDNKKINKEYKCKCTGFTLIEIMIVVAVATIIFAVALPSLDKVKINNSFSKAQASFLDKQIDLFDTVNYKFNFDFNDYESRGLVKGVGDTGSHPYENTLVADEDLFRKGYYMNLGGTGFGSCGANQKCGFGFRLNNKPSIGNVVDDYNFSAGLFFRPTSKGSGTRPIMGVAENGSLGSDGFMIVTFNGQICAWLDRQTFCGIDFDIDNWYYILMSVKNNGNENVTVDLHVNDKVITKELTGVFNDGSSEDTLSVGSSCCVQFRAFGDYDEIILADEYFVK